MDADAATDANAATDPDATSPDPSAEDEAGTSGSDPAEDDGGTDMSGQDAERRQNKKAGAVMRAWPTTPRVILAIVAAVVLAAVVAVTAGLLQPSAEPSGGAEGGPDSGTCTAAPGAEQQDVDPDDSPETPWPHVRGERVVVHFATGGLPARYAGLVDQAAGIWAQSPCVEPVAVNVCPPESNCSTVVVRERGRRPTTPTESQRATTGAACGGPT